MVEVIVIEEDYRKAISEFIGIGVFMDELDSITLPYSTKYLEKVKSFLLSKLEFGGEFEETAILYSDDGDSIKTIFLIGMGNKENFIPERARLIVGKVNQKVKELGLTEFAVTLKTKVNSELVSAMTEGIKLADYSFNRYKTNTSAKSQREIEKSYILVQGCNEELKSAARMSS